MLLFLAHHDILCTPHICVTQLLNIVVQLGWDPVTRHLSTVNLTIPCDWSQGACGHFWLPVLANIASLSHAYQKVATDNLLDTVENRLEWPLHAYIVYHPEQWLSFRQTIWTEAAPIVITTQWEEIGCCLVFCGQSTPSTRPFYLATCHANCGHCWTVSR